MFNIIQYTPDLQITNLDQLPKGTGARFLEVIRTADGPFIAVRWWRGLPVKTLERGRALVRFATQEQKPIINCDVRAVEKLLKACKVIAWTEATHEFLTEHDPKALEQLHEAMRAIEPGIVASYANKIESGVR